MEESTNGQDRSLWDEVVERAILAGVCKSKSEANQVCSIHQPHPGWGCLWEICPLKNFCPCGD